VSTPRRREWLAPILAGARSRDRLLAILGGTIAVTLTGWIAALYAPGQSLPFLVASLGSSTVLLFAVPSSPMASPWAVLGGTTLSMFSGALMVHLLGGTSVAAGMSVGLAILLMSALRCLHPPGGGYALVAALAGPGTPAASWAHVLVPGAVSALILIACAWLFHRLVSGHSYPHRVAPAAASPFAPADIDAALAELDETFDISREDLDRLLEAAARHARKRKA
jgi:CBS domain-containing membrane protein